MLTEADCAWGSPAIAKTASKTANITIDLVFLLFIITLLLLRLCLLLLSTVPHGKIFIKALLVGDQCWSCADVRV
jgi:hypothetical protein